MNRCTLKAPPVVLPEKQRPVWTDLVHFWCPVALGDPQRQVEGMDLGLATVDWTTNPHVQIKLANLELRLNLTKTPKKGSLSIDSTDLYRGAIIPIFRIQSIGLTVRASGSSRLDSNKEEEAEDAREQRRETLVLWLMVHGS